MNDRELLKRYGHTLTDKQRITLELAAKGLSQRMIAHYLRVPRSTVQSRIESGIFRLREALDKEAA